MKVLLIEDDAVLGESLKEFLESKGFEVHWISDERKFHSPELAMLYDVVILDLILKFSEGEEILKDMRRRGINTPVIVLTAKTAFKDKETCFNLGADDYITKPFEPKELVLRIRACTRLTSENKVKIGSAEIDLSSMIVIKEGEEVKLSRTAGELLKLLIKNRGKVITTETILNSVWCDKPVGNEVVRTYIKELRKVLPEGAIETHKGIGYRLK